MTDMRLRALALGLSVVVAATPAAQACTNLRLMTANGYPIYGSIMEFASATIPWQLAVYPRGTRFAGIGPNGCKGLAWTGKFGGTYIPEDTVFPCNHQGRS